jgi:hypothetical protein
MITHHLLSIVTKIVTCGNTYTMESKDEFILVNFFFIQYLLLFVTNVTCDLSKANKGILIANVACE